MPRFRRIVIPETCHHVTQRGNMRRDVFFTAQDRQVYLGLLKEYSEHYHLRFLGYCLMTNHMHLVVVPGDEMGLGKAMREINGRYARYRNAIDRGCGHVWQGRFYSCPFEALRLASVMRYVELNPVRAGMVRKAGDYAWSSTVIHLGGRNDLGLVDTADWDREWNAGQWSWMLSHGDDEGDAIRVATYAGRPFGGDEFVERLEVKCARRLRPAKPGPKPREEARVA